MRGKRRRQLSPTTGAGSIPACAGETTLGCISPNFSGVYPRLCGGNFSCGVLPLAFGGLSPLVRGKRRKWRRGLSDNGSIPACAGETSTALPAQMWTRVYPRLCGGNIDAYFAGKTLLGLSPLVRGKLPGLDFWIMGFGSIPACAGETCELRHQCVFTGVYPRLCGGNKSDVKAKTSGEGLSPLVRGKHRSTAVVSE